MSGGERVVISRATVDDAGVYRCLAISPAGQDSKLVKLEVHAAPRINVSALPRHITVIPRGNALLSMKMFTDTANHQGCKCLRYDWLREMS